MKTTRFLFAMFFVSVGTSLPFIIPAEAQNAEASLTFLQAMQKANACYNKATDTPEGQLVANYLPRNVQDFTPEQLADTRLLNDALLPALSVTYRLNAACREQFLIDAARIDPGVSDIFKTAYAEADNNRNAFINKQISRGALLSRNKEITQTLLNQVIPIMKAIDEKRVKENGIAYAQQSSTGEAHVDKVYTPRTDWPAPNDCGRSAAYYEANKVSPSVIEGFRRRLLDATKLTNLSDMIYEINKIADEAKHTGPCWTYTSGVYLDIAPQISDAIKIVNNLKAQETLAAHNGHDSTYDQCAKDAGSNASTLNVCNIQNCLRHIKSQQDANVCQDLAHNDGTSSAYPVYTPPTSLPTAEHRPEVDMLTAIQFGIYKIVKTCAENKLVYNADQVNAIMAAIRVDLDKRQVSKESRNTVWNLVDQKTIVHTDDCEKVGANITQFFPPDIFANTGEKNPF